MLTLRFCVGAWVNDPTNGQIELLPVQSNPGSAPVPVETVYQGDCLIDFELVGVRRTTLQVCSGNVVELAEGVNAGCTETEAEFVTA